MYVNTIRNANNKTRKKEKQGLRSYNNWQIYFTKNKKKKTGHLWIFICSFLVDKIPF